MNDIFTDANEARKYVLGFSKNFFRGRKISYVDTTNGRRIYFYNMTDDEAISVANMLKRDIEIPAIKKGQSHD